MNEREPQYQALAALLDQERFPAHVIQALEPRLLPAGALPLVNLADQPRLVIDLQALLRP